MIIDKAVRIIDILNGVRPSPSGKVVKNYLLGKRKSPATPAYQNIVHCFRGMAAQEPLFHILFERVKYLNETASNYSNRNEKVEEETKELYEECWKDVKDKYFNNNECKDFQLETMKTLTPEKLEMYKSVMQLFYEKYILSAG